MIRAGTLALPLIFFQPCPLPVPLRSHPDAPHGCSTDCRGSSPHTHRPWPQLKEPLYLDKWVRGSGLPSVVLGHSSTSYEGQEYLLVQDPVIAGEALTPCPLAELTPEPWEWVASFPPKSLRSFITAMEAGLGFLGKLNSASSIGVFLS